MPQIMSIPGPRRMSSTLPTQPLQEGETRNAIDLQCVYYHPPEGEDPSPLLTPESTT
jgi:hypothetical protein